MPQLHRFTEGEYCYFVTSGTQDRCRLFRDRHLCYILLENLWFYRDRMKFGLHGYVIMPDHVHLLITPRQPTTISDVMRNLKSYTGKQIGAALGIQGPVWQRRFFDHVIRNEKQFRTTLDYIHLNPVKAGLADSADIYEFSSYRFWEHGDRSLPLDPLDGHGWGRDLQDNDRRRING